MTSTRFLRSNYRILVAAMKDVTDLLLTLSSQAQRLEGFLFFMAPRVDFRQSLSRVPDFLREAEGVEAGGCVRRGEAGEDEMSPQSGLSCQSTSTSPPAQIPEIQT